MSTADIRARLAAYDNSLNALNWHIEHSRPGATRDKLTDQYHRARVALEFTSPDDIRALLARVDELEAALQQSLAVFEGVHAAERSNPVAADTMMLYYNGYDGAPDMQVAERRITDLLGRAALGGGEA